MFAWGVCRAYNSDEKELRNLGSAVYLLHLYLRMRSPTSAGESGIICCRTSIKGFEFIVQWEDTHEYTGGAAGVSSVGA